MDVRSAIRDGTYNVLDCGTVYQGCVTEQLTVVCNKVARGNAFSLLEL